MKLVAITGSVATGKSFVLEIFKELGAPTFSCDAELREIMNTDENVMEMVRQKFPEAIINGTINRDALGGIIFNDALRKKELEDILYPALFIRREAFIKQHSAAAVIAIEVPLLYEKNLERDYDIVIVTVVSRRIQELRAEARGLSRDRLRSILKNQLPDGIKVKKADYVIDTRLDKLSIRNRIEELMHSCI